MFPFNLVVAMAFPYSAGYYRHGQGQLYVSRGTGFWGLPLRIGSPPEIVKVTSLAPDRQILRCSEESGQLGLYAPLTVLGGTLKPFGPTNPP
jgi:hypothetical protein